MKKVLTISLLLLLMVSGPALANYSVGLQQTGNLDGFSVKQSEKGITRQAIGSIYADGSRTNLEGGVRYLHSLGKQGTIDRYVGGGVGYSYHRPSGQTQGVHTLNGQGVIGIEFPLAYGDFVSPFDVSFEGALLIEQPVSSHLRIRNSIGTAIHYRF